MLDFAPRTIVEENLDCLLRKNKLGGTSSIYRKLPDSEETKESVLFHPGVFPQSRFYHFLFTALLLQGLEYSIVGMDYKVPCRNLVPGKPFPCYIISKDDAWTLYFCIDKVVGEAFPGEVFDTSEMWGDLCKFCGQASHV